MRFMVLVPANPTSEAGTLPSGDALAEMGKYNEMLVKAGVMKAGEGLHPTSKGSRVHFEKGKEPTVKDGPFTDQGLIAGYWVFECASHAEAVEWVKKAPFASMHLDPTTIEIRRIFAAADFAPSDPTGELRAKEAELRAQVERK